eukprot:3586094-Rhodomonas_salina.1
MQVLGSCRKCAKENAYPMTSSRPSLDRSTLMSLRIFFEPGVSNVVLSVWVSFMKVATCGVTNSFSQSMPALSVAGSEHETKPTVSRYLPDSIETLRESI